LKKIILFLFLISSLFAEAKFYTGFGYGMYDENFTDGNKAQSSSSLIKLKAGYGDRSAYAIEFSIDKLKNESNIFSSNDSDKTGLNIELIKAFDFDIYINPFFKAGFGAGYFKVDRELQDTLNYGSFNLGLGFFIPINEHFDLECTYDYKYITYEAIDTIAKQISYKSHLNALYFGFNVRF